MKIRDATRNELIKFHQIQLREAEQHRKFAQAAVRRADNIIKSHRGALQRLTQETRDNGRQK